VCSIVAGVFYLNWVHCLEETKDVFQRFPCVCLQVDVKVLFFCPMAQQPTVGQGLLKVEASQSHSVRHATLVVLLWMNDQPDAETST
jgi:hypothetical protein